MTREILDEALGLKALPRAGWVRAGVPTPESVAAHSWGVAWLALVLCPPELDLRRVLAIAVLHDLPEVRAGDITPHDGLSRADKHSREHGAAVALFEGRPDLLALWEDYAHRSSPEARFVHALDKLDMALQAQRYQRESSLNLQEFLASARATLAGGGLAALLEP